MTEPEPLSDLVARLRGLLPGVTPMHSASVGAWKAWRESTDPQTVERLLDAVTPGGFDVLCGKVERDEAAIEALSGDVIRLERERDEARADVESSRQEADKGWAMATREINRCTRANEARALMREERDALREDVRLAADELMVDMAEAAPGTTVARLLSANRIMRQERDEWHDEVQRVTGECYDHHEDIQGQLEKAQGACKRLREERDAALGLLRQGSKSWVPLLRVVKIERDAARAEVERIRERVTAEAANPGHNVSFWAAMRWLLEDVLPEPPSDPVV